VRKTKKEKQITKNKTDMTMSPMLSSPKGDKSIVEYHLKTGVSHILAQQN
jgi:hypothetical protein